MPRWARLPDDSLGRKVGLVDTPDRADANRCELAAANHAAYGFWMNAEPVRGLFDGQETHESLPDSEIRESRIELTAKGRLEELARVAALALA